MAKNNRKKAKEKNIADAVPAGGSKVVYLAGEELSEGDLVYVSDTGAVFRVGFDSSKNKSNL